MQPGGRTAVLVRAAAAAFALWVVPPTTPSADAPVRREEAEGKPKVVLRAAPAFAIAPARIRLTAELRGGADDFEPYYCAAIEWDWDDGTRSESALDCEPYQRGQSRIGRWFIAHHVYDAPGGYRPTFRLRKRGKIVGRARTQIEIRSGMARLEPPKRAMPGPSATERPARRPGSAESAEGRAALRDRTW